MMEGYYKDFSNRSLVREIVSHARRLSTTQERFVQAMGVITQQSNASLSEGDRFALELIAEENISR